MSEYWSDHPAVGNVLGTRSSRATRSAQYPALETLFGAFPCAKRGAAKTRKTASQLSFKTFTNKPSSFVAALQLRLSLQTFPKAAA